MRKCIESFASRKCRFSMSYKWYFIFTMRQFNWLQFYINKQQSRKETLSAYLQTSVMKWKKGKILPFPIELKSIVSTYVFTRRNVKVVSHSKMISIRWSVNNDSVFLKGTEISCYFVNISLFQSIISKNLKYAIFPSSHSSTR